MMYWCGSKKGSVVNCDIFYRYYILCLVVHIDAMQSLDRRDFDSLVEGRKSWNMFNDLLWHFINAKSQIDGKQISRLQPMLPTFFVLSKAAKKYRPSILPHGKEEEEGICL